MRIAAAFAVLVVWTAVAASPVPRFENAAKAAGIDHVNLCGKVFTEKLWLTETMGAGSAWLDYDGDSHLDLYVVGGSTHEAPLGARNRLYRGDGKGKFKDVTAASAAGHRGWGYGVAVGDYDNDGDPDLYVTNLGANVLLRNKGDGKFEDVTKKAAVGDEGWGTSAAFFDMENDGDLDLFVSNYVMFDTKSVPARGSERAKPPFCVFKGAPVVCGPLGLPPADDRLYRNNGDGTFTDVSETSGLWKREARYALGVVTGDYDNDGDQDIYVANDSVPNTLWRNNGDGAFDDAGVTTLAALSFDGHPQAGMGVDIADFDGDGWLDLVVTNFSHDLNTVYRNLEGELFIDESTGVGMGGTSMALSWGAGFYDFDNDADLDLFIANGHVYPEMEQLGIGTKYYQTNHLFLNGGNKFRDVSKQAGPGLQSARSFRGAAFADYDEDGDLDIFVTAVDDAGLLLRNQGPAGHYLRVRLVGKESNRDGVGARVTVTAKGRKQMRERKGGGSYLSASEPHLHFGLGQAARAELVEVRWPSGKKDVLRDVAVDRVLTITEGESAKRE